MYDTLAEGRRSEWTTLLRIVCCSPRVHPDDADTPQDVWLELSEIFAQVFGDEEYTWSDLVAGLRLVHESHKHDRSVCRVSVRVCVGVHVSCCVLVGRLLPSSHVHMHTCTRLHTGRDARR